MDKNDLIYRNDLLAAYDAAHKGPPGGARKLIEEAPSVYEKYSFDEYAIKELRACVLLPKYILTNDVIARLKLCEKLALTLLESEVLEIEKAPDSSMFGPDQSMVYSAKVLVAVPQRRRDRDDATD